ncbi:MAG: glycosyltransferase family 39 protein, partial [Acidobacteriota bacterium]
MTRERWLLAAILGVGLLLRLTYLLEIVRTPDFDLPQFEAQYHDYWARALLSGDWTPPEGVTDPEIPQRPYFRPPGYPFVLAGIYSVAGPSYLWPRVLQMLLGLASCLLLFSLTRFAFGTPPALFAAALAAVYWLFIFFEGELMAVGLLIFLLLAILRLAASWSQAFTVQRALVTGLLLGVAVLVRPNAAALAPVLVLWAGWLAWRRGG